MDELDISGRRYISSRRAAKEHRYHPDYIGQLVRTGKVVGEKVGRTWYVDASSLSVYLDKSMRSEGSDAKEPIKSEVAVPASFKIEEKKEKEEVPLDTEKLREPEEHLIPILKISKLEEKPTFISNNKSSGLKYIPDNEPLFPKIEPKKSFSDYIHENIVSEIYTETPKQNNTLSFVYLWSLALLGIVSFALSLGVSYVLESRTVVVKGEEATASVSFIPFVF